jgi:hypothetical protein
MSRVALERFTSASFPVSVLASTRKLARRSMPFRDFTKGLAGRQRLEADQA